MIALEAKFWVIINVISLAWDFGWHKLWAESDLLVFGWNKLFIDAISLF